MTLPLEGVRILDLSHVVAGPFSSMLLADSGAEVIKIEKPNEGEYGRRIGPFISNEEGEETAACFLRMNRNKKSVTIDLKNPEGKSLFLELVKKSDVIIENFRPGTMEKLGLEYEKLKYVNPRIIMASISGFGQKEEGNKYWKRPSYNMIAQALGGLMDVTGYKDSPPLGISLPYGDLLPGLYTAFAITQAVIQRTKTEKGQYIDLSMYDVLTLFSERNIINYQITQTLPVRGEEQHISPHDAYKAEDGYFVIDCYSNREWNIICRMMGHEEWVDHEDFNSGSKRAGLSESHIRPMIEQWAADKTKNQATEMLTKEGIAAAPVQNADELIQCEHLKHRNMFVEVEDQVAGRIKYPGNPIKFSNVPKHEFTPAPLLGADTSILKDLLNLTETEYKELKKKNVI